MYNVNFVKPPITNRTTFDVAEAVAWNEGIREINSLADEENATLQDEESKNLTAEKYAYEYIGVLNYTDLNRIEYNICEVGKMLFSLGYPIARLRDIEDYSICSDGYMWNINSIPYLEYINVIRTNAQKIVTQFLRGAFDKTIRFHNVLDYLDVNAIEETCSLSVTMANNLVSSAPICNAYICGE